MKAVRCPHCNLLVGPSADPDAYGQLLIASTAYHFPLEHDGYAMPAEGEHDQIVPHRPGEQKGKPAFTTCSGSQLLGHVVPVED